MNVSSLSRSAVERGGRTLAATALLAAATAVGTAAIPATAHAVGSASEGAAAVDARVRVVAPGQRVDLGHGLWLTLTATEVCQGGGQSGTECNNLANGNQAPDSVSLRTTGLAGGPTLYQALYLGTGTAARITLTATGRSKDLRIVTLAGHPGYAVGYGWAPAAASVGITVRDAAGGVLATL
ncbi:hypothetical protein EDD99_5720 [Streptomyces sp. 846.5]|nr:hypothetical protein [Streptomyces sp. 846.5]TDT97570.1 hypothetical protein EDD99_5720 [Streptomyces sp. 846.5]